MSYDIDLGDQQWDINAPTMQDPNQIRNQLEFIALCLQ